MKPLISYIFPVYNESDTLATLHDVLSAELAKVAGEFDFEIIYVNDGSADDSLGRLTALQHADPRVVVINFARNFGHQMAITAGLDYAKGDAAIIMDSDLQDPPGVSVELIRKWQEGFEVVYAQRRSRRDGFAKKLTAVVYYRLLDRLADISIPKDTGDFRLLDRKVVEQMKRFRERNRFMRGLTSYVGFKQTAVLFDREERHAGETNYPLKKMIKLALDGITSFSTVPLKLISQIGFGVSLLSFLGIIYALVIRLFFPDIAVPGFAFTVISVFFLGGVQLLMLGLLGTYIGRIYSEVQNRPLYIVDAVLKNDRPASSPDPAAAGKVPPGRANPRLIT